MASFEPIESLIHNGALNTVGDPTFLGLLVLGFFLAFIFFQNTRFDAKMVVIIPATFLAIAFAPILMILTAFILSGLLYLALNKLISR